MIGTRLIFILAALLLMTATIHAVVIPGRWEKVDGLAPGTPIIIELRSGVREECILQESNPIDLLYLDAQEIER